MLNSVGFAQQLSEKVNEIEINLRLKKFYKHRPSPYTILKTPIHTQTVYKVRNKGTIDQTSVKNEDPDQPPRLRLVWFGSTLFYYARMSQFA